MNRRELLGAALTTGAATVIGVSAANAASSVEPDGWMMRSKDYCKIIPDGELERWKFNWKYLLLDGRAEIVPLYKGDAVPREQLTFASLEEMNRML
jgi:hypothetical protein